MNWHEERGGRYLRHEGLGKESSKGKSYEQWAGGA